MTEQGWGSVKLAKALFPLHCQDKGLKGLVNEWRNRTKSTRKEGHTHRKHVYYKPYLFYAWRRFPLAKDKRQFQLTKDKRQKTIPVGANMISFVLSNFLLNFKSPWHLCKLHLNYKWEGRGESDQLQDYLINNQSVVASYTLQFSPPSSYSSGNIIDMSQTWFMKDVVICKKLNLHPHYVAGPSFNLYLVDAACLIILQWAPAFLYGQTSQYL